MSAPSRDSFEDHVARVTAVTEDALGLAAAGGHDFDGVVFHAGESPLYHADDQHPPFHRVPHFARYAPVDGPGHLVVHRKGERPRLIHVVPRDFWYEAPTALDHPYAQALDVEEVGDAGGAIEAAGDLSGCAYVGNAPAVASRLGIEGAAVEPEGLLAALDWYRALKTPYEVTCLKQAAERAAAGHAVVRVGAAAHLDERALHFDYLEATGHLDHELPYPTIIGWDDRAAVLHYQSKRTEAPCPGHTLLIDAGATVHGYHSDITRTWIATSEPDDAFVALLDGMEELQRELVSRVAPGVPFGDLHHEATRGIGALLVEVGVLKVSLDEALAERLVWPFFPHGLGHHLGLQVHDVGGKFRGPDGELLPSPEAYPHLRNTRTLATGHVVTIEPGLYFIPILLDPLREGPHAGAVDWALVDRLIPLGGVRIEDDILVTDDGQEDLSRPFVPGHRGS